jgi:hypothetical protein
VTGNLAAFADLSSFLDFNERANLCFIADLAAVKIHESGDPNIPAELYIWRNELIRR